MKPTRPWSRHSRHHHVPAPDAGERQHHPHGHPGRERFDSPRSDGGGRRHHPPFGGGPGDGFGGRFGGGPHGPRGRRGGRAGRGDVRTALLLLLAEQPMHGYQLMQAVAERTGGGWKLSPGAVYPTIAQLEDEGLVAVVAEGGRKLVTLTDAGRDHLATLGDADPFAAFTGEASGVDLRSALGLVMGAAHQVGQAGDPAQQAAALQVLEDARRSLYLILAGERPAGAPRTAGEQPG